MKDVKLYRVKNSKVGGVKTIDVDCPKSETRACAHYYSTIKAGRSESFTCSASHNHAQRVVKSPATEAWKREHKDGTWKAFTAAKYVYGPGDDELDVSCQADEWPPAYFLSDEHVKQGTKSTRGQLVRWIPREPNRDAGNLWQNWCKANDGDVGNGQRTPRVNDQWEQGGE